MSHPTLRSPQPLPYDVVDELIDEQFEFFAWCELSTTQTWWTAARRNGNIHNYTRTLCEIQDDLSYYWDEGVVEDEEGYVDGDLCEWGMLWSAAEWNEEELDSWVRFDKFLNPRDLRNRSKTNA